ncbi:protein hunchback-like isoform X2 [Microplitis mediator]|uniref:protein hunchback-like isoform X2 n=1 Tax=Microplitis mediator TaxID=375433 RepID=UPI002557100B|nr:protein hunchback-like isoform X2 [Microplitis mediator]
MNSQNSNIYNPPTSYPFLPTTPMSHTMPQFYEMYPGSHQNHTYTGYSPRRNGGMTRSESEESNNTTNDFQSGPQNGPTSSTFGYYAQLSPPYSPGSEGYLSSVAASPALPQSSLTLFKSMHWSSYVSQGPFHPDIPAHPTSNLTARASPSSSTQSDGIRNNIHQHENDVNCSLPNTENDGGPFNDDVPQDFSSDEENSDEVEGESKARSKIIDKNTYLTEPGWLIPKINKRGVEQIVKCKKCKKQFNTKVKMWNHLAEVHFTSGKMIRCTEPYCAFVTDLKHHWEYHMYRHTGIKPFGCDLCKYRCINKAMLKSHMKSHSNTYEYHCASCPLKSKFHHTFKQHLEETGHRQGKTYDEYGNLCNKIIDVGGKRRGPRKPGQKKSKTSEATIVSPPETPHYRLSPAQVAPLDLSTTDSSINPMDLSTFGSEIATPTESLPKVSGSSRRKGKAVKCVRKQVRKEIHELNSSLTIKKEPVDIPEEPPVDIGSCYCQHCQVFFGFHDLYNEHMRYHTIGDPTRCKICHKRYENAVSFYRHIGVEPHNV